MIILTRNRAQSLRTTLAGLAPVSRPELRVEVIVIDDGSSDHTCYVAESFRDRLPLRSMEESRPDKSFALSPALDADALGFLVVILDDDMRPEETSLQGVSTIRGRWPDCDYFTGRGNVTWPNGPYPRSAFLKNAPELQALRDPPAGPGPKHPHLAKHARAW